MDKIEHMAYASILTIPEHPQAEIGKSFCFLFHACNFLFLYLGVGGHVLLTDFNKKTITTIAKEDLANALLYPENMEFVYS